MHSSVFVLVAMAALRGAFAAPQNSGCATPTATVTINEPHPQCLRVCIPPTSACSAGEPTGPTPNPPVTSTMVEPNACTATIDIWNNPGCNNCATCTSAALIPRETTLPGEHWCPTPTTVSTTVTPTAICHCPEIPATCSNGGSLTNAPLPTTTLTEGCTVSVVAGPGDCSNVCPTCAYPARVKARATTTFPASTSTPSPPRIPQGIMEDEVIEDCIVVADNAMSTVSNKATSESNGNNHEGLTDDTAAQERDPGEMNKPHSPSQAPTPQTKFHQMSPTKARKAQSQVRRQPRSIVQKQFDGEDDCDYDPSDDSDDFLSDDSEPLESRFNLRSKETLEQQDVRISLRRSQNIDNMGTKRPRRPDSGDDQPRKRAVHKPLDAAGDRGLRRGPNKGHTQARLLTHETEDDSDDIPIAPTVRRRLRTRGTSSPESTVDTTFPQLQKDETQPLCHSDKAVEEKLEEAYQELSEYREALKKERAKCYGLEQQSLLWQARQLAAQDEEQTTTQRKSLPMPRPSSSIAVHGEIPASTSQVTQAKYQRVLELNKQLEGRLWDAELVRLNKTEGAKGHGLNQADQEDEQQKQAESKTEALLSTEQEISAIAQRQIQHEHENARQHAEKALSLENQVVDLTQKLQEREAAVKEEVVKSESLNSTVLIQRQQLLDGRFREIEKEKEIVDLAASRSQLQEKVQQLESELREAVESSVETRTRELNTELNKRQTTIEQLKNQVNDVQEELDWYKDRLDEFRTKYVEDMRARDQAERDRVLYILGDC
ncbi:hypothetical protein VSDG_05277 [Cytospora chrysosperma]|uniref:TATA element modulatory factor 1 TATA binding domain-containing protein n=1 Tax=Cytospora chrysosperma TaxID=252740 RepID=A0A423VX00_CYTCH|nr:hypothetical protein VSDG_05277 [Valsa sordida]